VSDVERSGGSNQAAPWRPPLSLILVSVLAAAAAVVHVAFPSLTIDAVTLGLLAVAALPWLAPVVKSLKFGSLEVDLRDLQQNVQEVKSRVEESAQKVEDLSDQVQRIVFSGAVDVGTRTELVQQANLDSNRLRIRKLSAQPGAAGTSAGDSQLRDALAWGGTLWRVRALLGAGTADRLLIESWKGIAKEPVLAAAAGFATPWWSSPSSRMARRRRSRSGRCSAGGASRWGDPPPLNPSDLGDLDDLVPVVADDLHRDPPGRRPRERP
jgi:hypothetical protein